MNELSDFLLPKSPVSLVVQRFADKLVQVRDLNGKKIFANVARGITLPEQNQIPSRDDMPCVRIWNDTMNLVHRSRPFLISQINPFNIDLYFYFYAFDRRDIQQYRDDLFAYLFDQWICEKTALAPNGMERESWYEIPQQEIIVDHTSAFKKFDGAIQPVKPPMYVTRVEVSVKLYTTTILPES